MNTLPNYTDEQMKPVFEHNIVETKDGGCLYVMITLDGKYLIAVSVLGNVGILIHEYNIEIDDCFSIEENCQFLIDDIEEKEGLFQPESEGN